MKNILTFLLLLISSICGAQNPWEKIDFPFSGNLSSLFFTDSITGWVAGDSGKIFKTVNGGINWTAQETGTSNEIADIFFINKNEGWASSFNYSQEPYGTVILKTIDGGNTWQHIPYPQENIFIHCIWFFDSLTGWMGGSPHALVKTTDGGLTWHQAEVDTSTLAFFPVETIKFWNRKYGYASGGIFDVAGVIWRTDNGGDKWYAISPDEAPADEVHGLHLYDSVTIIGAGGDPDFGYGVGMIRSSDGGIHWNYQELEMQGTALDIDFRNNHEAWAPLGSRRKMIFSNDAGTTWTETDTPDSSVIVKMNFPDSLHGYAVGREGTFLKYKIFGTGITPILLKNSLKAYPNPFHDHTNIVVEGVFDTREKISFIISDISGRELLRIPAQVTMWKCSSLLKDSDLPAGIYFCRISSEKYKYDHVLKLIRY